MSTPLTQNQRASRLIHRMHLAENMLNAVWQEFDLHSDCLIHLRDELKRPGAEPGLAQSYLAHLEKAVTIFSKIISMQEKSLDYDLRLQEALDKTTPAELGPDFREPDWGTLKKFLSKLPEAGAPTQGASPSE